MRIMPMSQTKQGRGERSCRSAGYTLVEVLCAVMIAAIAAAVLFVGFDNGFAILRTTREDMRATQILMQKTEAVRLCTWQQLTNVNNVGVFKEYYFPAGTTNPGTLYVGRITTTGAAANVPNSAVYKGNLHLVTITLAWTNFVGNKLVAHSRQMQTLSAKYGMQNYLFGGSSN
jgi:prepilin-type N-terminal cleavage/methylation domain-containing protein